MLKWLIAIIFILILVKTGKLGAAFGFLFKYALYPTLFSVIVGFIAGLLFGFDYIDIGAFIGALIGFVKVFKDGRRKIG